MNLDSHTSKCLELMHTLMAYRQHEIRHELQDVAKSYSMLHFDVLLLIYHFARVSEGSILEIGPYIGGSTIAAAFGTRDGAGRKIISIEPGGRLKDHRLASKDIFNDLKKNLARFKVLDRVFLIHDYSFAETTRALVREKLPPGSVGVFLIDADGEVGRDLDLYGDRLSDGCWLVIDDYFGPANLSKVSPTREQVNQRVAAGQLLPLGYYGWGTWIGRWQTSPWSDAALSA